MTQRPSEVGRPASVQARELADARVVLVLADGTKPTVSRQSGEVVAWLEGTGREVAVEHDLRAFAERQPAERGGFRGQRPDLLVVLGGDGSVLSAVRIFAEDPVPVIGINFGRVGFLAPVEAQHWREGLEEVLAGGAMVEPRMMLEARLGDSQERRTVALNDVVLARGATRGLATVRLEVDGEVAGDYHADGLIVATPSGSTAYSLAAGGPILAPAMGGIVVTPIAAHALSNRPLVLQPESVLTATVVRAAGRVSLVVDGHEAATLEEGGRVQVRRHRNAYPLLAPAGADPWRRLRERLGWRGSFLE